MTSGEDAEGGISCLSAGKGNNFESWYLNRSAESGGGMGEAPPGGADWGGKESADAEAEVDCMSGGCACCAANTPTPGDSPFSFLPLLRLTPLSRLTEESVLYRRSRALMLLVRERRPPLDPLRVKVFFIFSHVLMLSPGLFGVDSARTSSNSG